MFCLYFYRGIITLMKMFIYVLLIQFLSIEVERQVLIILIFLAYNSYFEIKTKPFLETKINDLSIYSNMIIISSYLLKLWSFSVGIEKFEIITSIILISVNSCFFIILIWEFFKINQKEVKDFTDKIILLISCLKNHKCNIFILSLSKTYNLLQ